MLRSAIKTAIHGVALVCILPAAILSAFGRVPVLFVFFSQLLALLPGLPGDYLRVAFYSLVLERCSWQARISFGTFFSHRTVIIEPGVYIGASCIIGSCTIGRRSQIASQVQILSGNQQHARNEAGEIQSSSSGVFSQITIGPDCWIGASAVIMADLGAKCTIGAGAVVTRPIPANAVAVGIPARPVNKAGTAQSATTPFDRVAADPSHRTGK